MEPSELRELERWLTERRQEIDRKYDYRYSVLPLVLATLLREGRLAEDDLHGLGQDKLEAIHRRCYLPASLYARSCKTPRERVPTGSPSRPG